MSGFQEQRTDGQAQGSAGDFLNGLCAAKARFIGSLIKEIKVLLSNHITYE